MQRRKFIAGVGSLAAAGAAGIGTGAFSSVSADRDFTVSVADDSNAFLRMESTDSANAGEFVSTTGNGVISIDATSTAAGGDGANREATTIVRDLFEVENQGTEGVYVWLENSPDGLGWFADDTPDHAATDDTGIEVGSQSTNAPLGHPESSNLYLHAGEKLGEIGFYVTDPDALEADDTTGITLRAATPDEIYYSNLGAYEDVDQYDSPEDDGNYSGPPSDS